VLINKQSRFRISKIYPVIFPLMRFHLRLHFFLIAWDRILPHISVTRNIPSSIFKEKSGRVISYARMEPDDNARAASNNKRGQERVREGGGRKMESRAGGWNYNCILNIGAHGMNRWRARPTFSIVFTSKHTKDKTERTEAIFQTS